MYVPPSFATDDDAAWEVVREAGAGNWVIAGDEGLRSVFAPVIVSEDRRTLSSHIARANPWWRGVVDGTDVLGLFVVASAYVSPSNYPSRFENPAVVPTWNYVAAEVRGRVVIRDDREWLAEQVRAQTNHFEAGRTPQWRVEDAPAEFIERQLGAIVGFTVTVSSIEGKAKLSQNRPAVDHDEVRRAMAQGTANEREVARRMDVRE